MATSNNSSVYRPTLKASHINRIIQLVKTHTSLSDPVDLEILSKLSVFKAKIDNLAITPAYTEKPKQPKKTVESSLGIPSLNEFTPESKEVYWERCYNKLVEEGAENLSVSQLKSAREWMYLKDLFTPEEKAEFESEMFTAINKRTYTDE